MREIYLIFNGNSRKAMIQLRVSGSIREGHMKEVTFDQEGDEMMRKWMFHIEGNVTHI